jgi:hypothetical membrane protein
MKSWHKRIRVFTDTYPLVGPTIWMACVQYFIVQAIVAANWVAPTAYSWRFNPISDLGNTVCQEFSMRYVCSPLHNLMNASFITLGLLMIAGSGLIYHEFRESTGSAVAFAMMAVAGFGTILVGIFPENTIAALHFTGALLPFAVGNIAVVLFGFVLGLTGWFRGYTILSGVVALIALVLFQAHFYLGLGQGGMERFISYPQTLWLIAFGLYMSRDRFKSAYKRYF